MVPSATFLVHLLQDVHVLRPLVFMAAHDFGFQTQLLVSDRFRARDTSGIWLNELEEICAQSGASLNFFGDDWQAQGFLKGQGLLFAASESHIHNHAIAHNVFRHAPPTYLKVTLQHGFECVGFRHGADHVRAYGETASFAADIVCSWYGIDQLTSLAPSQAPKVFVTGPTSVLQMAAGETGPGNGAGVVCENLHSVRFETADKLESEFLRTFRKFAGAMNRQGRRVRLRPHPGGQYSAKADAVLPRNVQLENAPLYRLDLRQFSYGISPPSSVLIDMLLAEIPTAVWRDRRGFIDVRNYDGLTTVSSADELVRFAQEAEQGRDRLLTRQRRWLERQGMPLEPADVYARFAKLFEAAERMAVQRPGSRAERERILVVTNDSVLMQQKLEEALATLAINGEVTSRTVIGRQLVGAVESPFPDGLCDEGIATSLDSYSPSVIFLCGKAVSTYKSILQWTKRQQVPVVYFLDHGTEGLGSDERISRTELDEVAALSELFHDVDVIYAPTEELKARLEREFPKLRTVAAPGAPQDLDQRQPLIAFRHELLRVIALGHASVSSRENRQVKKEVGVCPVR